MTRSAALRANRAHEGAAGGARVNPRGSNVEMPLASGNTVQSVETPVSPDPAASIEAGGRDENTSEDDDEPTEAERHADAWLKAQLGRNTSEDNQETSVPGEERPEVRTDTGADLVATEGSVTSETRLRTPGSNCGHRVEEASPTPGDRSGLGEEDRVLAEKRRQIAEDNRVQACIAAADSRAEREKNLRLASEKRLQLIEAKNRELSQRTEEAVVAVMTANHQRDNEARNLNALKHQLDLQEAEMNRITALYEEMSERIAARTGRWP